MRLAPVVGPHYSACRVGCGVDSKFEVPRVPVPHQLWFQPPFHSHLPPSSIVAARRVQSPDILIPRAAPLSLSFPPIAPIPRGDSKAACTSRRETSAPYRSLSTGCPKIISRFQLRTPVPYPQICWRQPGRAHLSLEENKSQFYRRPDCSVGPPSSRYLLPIIVPPSSLLNATALEEISEPQQTLGCCFNVRNGKSLISGT